MNESDNLQFVPKPVDVVCIRPGSGATMKITIGLIQRITAIRAYSKGVYNYCYHLFQENIDVLFGDFPNPEGKFMYTKCKKCK